MKLSIFVILAIFACACIAQKQNTTPVPILKQINRHNEDGSYSYGYEAADGSFKIETKAANGEVKGKYGYVDDSGNLREIEYGANKNGFQPSGDGINVAPPTYDDRNSAYPALAAGEIDDGQYREDPLMYNDPRFNSKPSKSSQFRANAFPAPAVQQPRPQYSQAQYTQANYRAQEQPAFRAHQQQPAFRAHQQQPQQSFFNEPQQTQTERPNYYQSRFTAPAAAPQNNYIQPEPQQNYYRPSNNYYQQQQPNPVDIFQGHPATNLDLSTGSYSVTYG